MFGFRWLILKNFWIVVTKLFFISEQLHKGVVSQQLFLNVLDDRLHQFPVFFIFDGRQKSFISHCQTFFQLSLWIQVVRLQISVHVCRVFGSILVRNLTFLTFLQKESGYDILSQNVIHVSMTNRHCRFLFVTLFPMHFFQ